jgi:hypothetical protein
MNSLRGSLEDRTRELRQRHIGGWSSEQLVRLLVGNGVGLLMIAASSYEATRATTMRDELAWLNVGVIGLAVAAVSNAIWLLRGRENVSFARAVLLPGANAVAVMVNPVGAERYANGGHSARLDHGGAASLAAVPGRARYHRQDCAFIAGRAAATGPRHLHEGNGLLPCEVCEP